MGTDHNVNVAKWRYYLLTAFMAISIHPWLVYESLKWYAMRPECRRDWMSLLCTCHSPGRTTNEMEGMIGGLCFVLLFWRSRWVYTSPCLV